MKYEHNLLTESFPTLWIFSANIASKVSLLGAELFLFSLFYDILLFCFL